MKKELADYVFPILNRGLRLRACLERGERVELAKERTELIRQLRNLPARPEFIGDGDQFLGIRYALACWLDELFILGLSPSTNPLWSDDWKTNAVEIEFHPNRERLRAIEFWNQEKLAQQFDADVLEVFYLCVLLGFRGINREELARLKEWRQRTEEVLKRERSSRWPNRPSDRPVPTDVSPLLARNRLLRAMLLLGAVVGLLVPLVTFFLVYLPVLLRRWRGRG